MNGTNVDYYASGFDAEGKRVGSLICDFDPTKEKNADKLAAFKGKAKELFDGAVSATCAGSQRWYSSDKVIWCPGRER